MNSKRKRERERMEAVSWRKGAFLMNTCWNKWRNLFRNEGSSGTRKKEKKIGTYSASSQQTLFFKERTAFLARSGHRSLSTNAFREKWACKTVIMSHELPIIKKPNQRSEAMRSWYRVFIDDSFG